MRISAGRMEDLPSDRCLTVGDGAAIVTMTDDGPRAYANRCLHVGSAMDDAWIRDGVLSCPLHFWRYRVQTGQLIGGTDNGDGEAGLARFPVDVIDGEVFVNLPEPDAPMSFRERQLKHAAEWNRDR